MEVPPTKADTSERRRVRAQATVKLRDELDGKTSDARGAHRDEYITRAKNWQATHKERRRPASTEYHRRYRQTEKYQAWKEQYNARRRELYARQRKQRQQIETHYETNN